jgi:phosphatidylglycerophosphate synthase
MLIASWLFFTGEIAAGLVAAWGMTFLDTVDGKLARVTVTSSELGNLLDHGTDIIHPPLWWFCLGFGLASLELEPQIWSALWVILGCYVAGRAIELAFHRLFGFNAFLFRPFDSTFRTIVARRNIILLIMTAGVLIGRPAEAFVACAAWSVVSTLIQLVRIAQARLQSRRGKLEPWMV